MPDTDRLSRHEHLATEMVPGWQHALALGGGVALWMVHLTAMMSMVGIACAEGILWPLHTVTVATAVPTALLIWLSWRIRDSYGATLNSRASSFLGWLAVAFNITNLVLIVFEWLPVVAVDPCLL